METCSRCINIRTQNHKDNKKTNKIELRNVKAQRNPTIIYADDTSNPMTKELLVMKPTPKPKQEENQLDGISSVEMIKIVKSLLGNDPNLAYLRTQDKYVFGTLTASPGDGSNEYIISQLMKSYKRMYSAESKECIARLCKIEYTDEGTPHMHMLFRYRRFKTDNSPVPAFVAPYKTEGEHKMLTDKGEKVGRKADVFDLTIHDKKNGVYKTSEKAVIYCFRYILKEGGEAGGSDYYAFM
jgi:hypothetical protein